LITNNIKSSLPDKSWQLLTQNFTLNEQQLNQLQEYLKTLITFNEQFNLTSIVEPDQIIAYHFYDSMIVSKFIDIAAQRNICDIGSGAGFPGIPLKILYPETPILLLEVNKKKIDFLWHVIEVLKLDFIEVCDMDWRTFLRKTDWQVDLFLSRASLHTDELMRVFQPACHYKDARLIYWASKDWQITKKETPFFDHEVEYSVKNKVRKLIFFMNPDKKTARPEDSKK
jgi:16S rRNA (guanine527-N7)-methyltransferase